DDKPMTAPELVEAVRTADVLVPTVTDRIDSRVLSQAGPRLKLIASFGTGVDHIDLDTARQRGITVTNTPGVLTEDTADLTMALVRIRKAGELAGAGLDVDEHEPQVNPKLLELDGVVLLPHMGSATLEGRIEMGEKVLINIKTFADGHKPPDRVLATMF